MKKKLALLMVSFLVCIGTMMAATTDLPEVSTDGNIKWYTIKNVRGNAYAAFTGSGVKMKLNSTIEDESYLFYFTTGENGGYKIHNAATSNLCAGHSSWTAAGINWYLRANSNNNYSGVSISHTEDFSGNNSWNDYQNRHTLLDYWSADDDGSAWAIELYSGDIASLKASKLQMSTNDEKHFYYIKNQRQNGKFANYVGQGIRFTQTSAANAGSYWYFVDATNDLPENTDIPEGCSVCRIYNAGNELGVENTSGNMTANSGVSWPAKIYFIRKYDKKYWDYIIYPYNESDAGWNDQNGTHVTNYDYDDEGSIWAIVASGKSETDLINEAATAKTNALAHIETAELADYFTYSDDAIATAKTAVKDLDVESNLVTATTSRIAIEGAISTLKRSQTNAGPVAGDRVMLKNRNYGNWLSMTIGWQENALCGKTPSVDEDPLLIWELQETGTDGVYYLYNKEQNVYAGPTPEWDNTNVPIKTTQAEAGKYQFVAIDGGLYAAVYDTQRDANGNSYLHHSNWVPNKELVRWNKTSEASQWIVTKIEEPEVEETNLYALQSPTGTYFNFTPVTPTGGATTNASFQNTPSFVYKVLSGESYYFEDLNNSGEYIGEGPSGTDWIVSKNNKTLWNISAPTDGYVTISRKNDSTKRLGHDGNTNAGTGVFTNVGTECNKWKLLPAYSVTIIYKNGEEVLKTVKSAAIAGTKYSFDIDTNSYDIVSCETDKGSIQESDGTCTIASVNGATTVTISITPIKEVVNPEAVVALVNRIGGIGTSNSFKFVHDRSLNGETFVIGAEEGKILIKGSTISAITTGLGWYLNNIAHINIAWNSLNEKTTTVKWDANAGYADLSNLPLPAGEETHTSDAQYRYYLNTCTFGYSMTSWTWTRWQQEIDWMALHGINMPLQLVGLEEVWRTFLIKCGYSETDAKAFVAGPAFIAWWAMNNLQGWGGTAAGSKSGYNNLAGAGGVQDDAWYARQKKLAKQILDAQRALGMQPVLPGWSGMVPTNFNEKTGYTTRGNGGNWAGDFVRPLLLHVNNANYAEIAADYYECLEAVMGESQYYSMDPFHEGGGAGTMEDYEALYAAMETAKPGSQWVIQQWQWSATQKYSLTAVPAGKLVVLDLFSDGSPAFDGYNGYAPQDAVFCAIPNFGGRSGLMGRLQNVTDNYFKFKGKYPDNIKGIGTAPEAIEQTPVTYDLIYQLPWMNGVKPNVAEWVDNYAVARYGKDNSVVKEAWSLLRQGPLNYGADGIQGPVEDVWAARPNIDANKASSWGTTLANAGGTYTPARRQMLIDAVYKLIDQEDELALTNGSVYKSNYLYDLVEFGGAVMADYAYDLLLGIKAAKNAAGANFASDATYKARRDAFLQLILDMDAFRGTNLNFRLGKWTQEARDAAGEVTGATTATADWYEYNNARTILTTWSSPGTNLTDYSYRSWQGLLKDYYYPRWKHYFDNNCTGAKYEYFEWNWAHGKEHYVGQTAISNVDLTAEQAGHTSKYTRNPEGNTVEKAVEMLNKYIIPVEMADGTHYAYRYLTNDLSSKVTIIVTGNTIDLTQYFGTLEGATVTGDFINGGSSTNLAEIPLKSNLDGAYTGTLTLADGTVLTFGVTANPKFYGVYKINYKNGNSDVPVFVGYNTDEDNGKNVGYKLIAQGTYSLTAELDKYFTVIPAGVGYSLSAQGKYLKAPNLGAWHHVMFSDNSAEAGVYLFEETSLNSAIYKLRHPSTEDNIKYINDYDKLVFGNDKAGKGDLATFTLEQVTTYAITIPASGYYGICLPFNVVLPTGVTAYDVTVENLTCGEDGAITSLAEIATEGQTLKAGTPALLKGTAGNYNLAITMDNTDAKTSSAETKLRGNFVKQTLETGTLNKFIYTNEGEHPFVRVNGEQEIPANTCWIEANIDAENVEVTEHEGKILKIDDWLFKYEVSENGSITLTGVAEIGENGDLNIGSYYTINGQQQRISAISPDFLHDNTILTSITLPATMTNLGFREIVPMFEGEYEGKAGNGTEVTDENGDTKTQGMHECFVFPKKEDGTDQIYKVSGNFAWRLTLDVTIDTESADFNDWGSSIVSTLPNSLADYYTNNLQIYMHKGHKNIVVKVNNSDDRYLYKTKVLDEVGNETEEDLVMTKFKFELEHDGAGGYQVVIYYENGKAKMYNISSSQQGTLVEFDRLYYSLPEGIHVKVKFEELHSKGLFVDCKNLTKIKVDPANPTFKSCDHGVLYDKNGYYVMRIPEGGTNHYEIPSKVVKLYPGAVHGVKADVVLHSNPQIGVVEGHEEDVKNAKFYLSLDDIDNTITENETGYGGARDFVSANNNKYLAARYKRAPLTDGKYGTICLPFVPENAMDKYDFYKLKSGTATTLTFSQVDKLEANTAYLYKLKENPAKPADLEGDEVFGTDASGNEVFETTEPFTVQTLAKYDPADEKAGSYRALGSFVNHYIETNTSATKKSVYYYYSISQKMFLRVTEKLSYRPYRAIFVVTPETPEQVAQAPARLNLVLLDGTVTQIDPSLVEGMEELEYYDLFGRRVLNPVSGGIYIVNGKKVLVK